MSMIKVRKPREEITMNMAYNNIIVEEKMKEMRKYAFETNLYTESKEKNQKKRNTKRYRNSVFVKRVG
jgi:hypothetical protein